MDVLEGGEDVEGEFVLVEARDGQEGEGDEHVVPEFPVQVAQVFYEGHVWSSDDEF